jgi:cysteine desulfurase
MEDARNLSAEVLGVPADTLYFTAGGTEANAIVLFSWLRRAAKGRLLYSAIEHPSVRENCLVLESLKIPTSVIGVEKDGRVSKANLSRALEKHPDTRFITIMGVNNETGAIMDVADIAANIREFELKIKHPIHFHCDYVQALAKAPIDISACDSCSFSAHKLGGQRGIGLLYLKKQLQPLYVGGGQEKGIRAGTENVTGAISFAEMLSKRARADTVKQEREKAALRMKRLILELKKIPRCVLIPQDRTPQDERFSPWILQARFRDVPGEVMVRALDDAGIAISTGSACSAGSNKRPVLEAMGLDETAQLEGVRISQGWTTTDADLDAL